MLSERIKQLRKTTNYRQEDVAKSIGVGRTTYAMYEQGRREPDYETLQKIAEFFNVTIEFLIKGENTENKNLFFFNLEGLSEEEIEDIKEHIEYMKWKKQRKDY